MLAGNLYEYLNRPAWHSALRRLQASRPDCLSPRGLAWQQPGCQPETGPSPESAMLRIFSSLVVGITSGMWVWANRKTVLIWHQLAVNCVCCGRGCRATRAMTAPPAYLCPTGPSPRRPDGLRAVGGGPLLHSLPYDLGLVGRETGEAGVYATGRGFPARLTASTMHCLTNGGGGGGGGGHLLVGGQTAPSGAQQMAAGQVGANISSAGSGSAVNSASGTMPSHVQMVSTANGPSSLSGPPSHLYSSGGYSLGPANLATAAAPHLSELAVESAGQATDGLAGARLTHPLFLPDEAQPLSGSSGLKEFVCLSGPPSTTSASGPDYPAYPPASMTAYSMPPAPATHQALLRPDQAQPGLFVEPSVGVILASGASSSSKTSHKYASCV
ncbi:unnamed protein product [Protopolystoma xenopodis]|uniref:Frizzled/Smoothened 7TM domain-containing protein n=1 Tax=Protopolystoma xenopodis TaxID=117903 RepID=A0A448X6X9_9PLAT|nr:unnamed protein product [Protopolystoma xenopodis]